MARIALTEGFYQSASLISDAQRCSNLYLEKNPTDSPFPFTSYLTPGLTTLCEEGVGPVRCLYRASNNSLYGVIGQNVYYISPNYNGITLASLSLNFLGTILSKNSIVSMKDNRLMILIVDGTSNGYAIDLTNNNAFSTINIPSFYGSTRVDFRDTFFLLNQPNSNNFYTSSSETDIAQMIGGPILTGTVVGGVNYADGLFPAVALTNTTTIAGLGATADLTVTSGTVSNAVINVGGDLYLPGDVLSASNFDLSGAVLTLIPYSPGSGYVNGEYANVSLIGGTGTGAAATLLITNGGVSSSTITLNGSGYSLSDLLTASSSSLGGVGGGFGVTVGTVSSGSGSGFTYTVTSVDAGVNAFPPLYIAAKTTDSDSLVSVIATNQQIWLIGQRTTELWYDAGSADFTFGRIPGTFVEHGCAAPYSICKADQSVLWLSEDKDGHAMVMAGQNYTASRVSTHAIENVFASYTTVADAVAFTYQQRGHTFYQLNFPSADATWVYDLATQLWSEKTWIDTSGIEHRHRAQVGAFCYGVNIVGDWQNGLLYNLDPNAYTDNGSPIVRRRGFPHIVNEGKRLSYDRFILEIDVGESVNTSDVSLFTALETSVGNSISNTTALYATPRITALEASGTNFTSPGLSLRWSDTKGKSFGYPIQLPMGATGEFLTSVQARNLGLGRDRVFEVFWSGDFATALNGIYIDVSEAET